MKKCKDIQELLPLHLDDSLSAADKEIVAEHLKSCPHCTKELSRLSKAATLVNNIHEVNPPPWFKQKIMARVREEAQKESFIQKWFYPLKIKIPVQVFATICIAVLATYIYRTGEEHMKEVVPSSAPAPVVEVQKSPLPEQKLRTSTGEYLHKEKQATQPPAIQDDSVHTTLSDAVRDVKQQEAKGENISKDKSAPAPEPVALSETQMATSTNGNIRKEEPLTQSTRTRKLRIPTPSSDLSGDVKQKDAKGIKADQYESAPAAEAVTLPGPTLEKKKADNVMGTAIKAGRAPQAQSPIRKSNILLKVSDIAFAVEEAEKLLVRYETKNITRQIKQDKTIIMFQMKNQKIKDFLMQLEKIGYIEESVLPVADAEGNVTVAVEFSE